MVGVCLFVGCEAFSWLHPDARSIPIATATVGASRRRGLPVLSRILEIVGRMTRIPA